MHTENTKYGLNKKLSSLLQTSIFFLLFFLYLWLVAELRLIHHGAGTIRNFPVFFTGFGFFLQFAKYPGGIVEYVSAALAQLFYFSPAGAAVVTLQAWLLTLTTDYYLKTINASPLRPLRFVPPILLLIIYSQYVYHFTTTMHLLTTLAFVALYLTIAGKTKHFHFLAYIVLSLMLYYLAGAAFLLFALLCIIYELFFNRRSTFALLYLISAAIIPYALGVLVFGLDSTDAFTKPLPCSPGYLFFLDAKKIVFAVYAMYLLLPAAAIISPLANKIITPKIQRRFTPPAYLRFTSLILITAVIALTSYNENRKILFEIDYYVCRADWNRVIKTAKRSKKPDIFISHAVNLALYHTGTLGDEMFEYPQHKDVLFLTGPEHYHSRWRRFETCLQLGLINKAESDMTESLERFGPTPLILKRLALTNLIKGNLDTAKIYLNTLKKSLFFSDWTGQYLKKIKTDPTLRSDPDIQRVRSVMAADNTQNILSSLFYKTPQNKMQFEYLMAYYLLTRKTELLVQKLSLLDRFGYSKIPRHYQEAALSHMYTNQQKSEALLKKISPQTIQRFQDFLKEYKSFGKNQSQAKKKLAPQYGDTYFFYYIYGY